ncbi:hypothetical protein [Methanosphaera cuniculi]|uniref:Uncharacterized protein n=1 Tax=Methanosphaera cuniculi TaxID=1077256 RepID=A0A2V2BJL6_9EURY|nr:hypothetical protein [Methanosphaera cuniculi]PWL08142.1 hypothetical protein MSCUN_10730 [Methanosphaera cuniculi]
MQNKPRLNKVQNEYEFSPVEPHIEESTMIAYAITFILVFIGSLVGYIL